LGISVSQQPYTPNFSKDESHALHISIVRQKTGPGISSELRSGDSSRFSCFYMPTTSFQAPLKMYGTRALAYSLKFPSIWFFTSLEYGNSLRHGKFHWVLTTEVTHYTSSMAAMRAT